MTAKKRALARKVERALVPRATTVADVLDLLQEVLLAVGPTQSILGLKAEGLLEGAKYNLIAAQEYLHDDHLDDNDKLAGPIPAGGHVLPKGGPTHGDPEEDQ